MGSCCHPLVPALAACRQVSAGTSAVQETVRFNRHRVPYPMLTNDWLMLCQAGKLVRYTGTHMCCVPGVIHMHIQSRGTTPTSSGAMNEANERRTSTVLVVPLDTQYLVCIHGNILSFKNHYLAYPLSPPSGFSREEINCGSLGQEEARGHQHSRAVVQWQGLQACLATLGGTQATLVSPQNTVAAHLGDR